MSKLTFPDVAEAERRAIRRLEERWGVGSFNGNFKVNCIKVKLTIAGDTFDHYLVFPFNDKAQIIGHQFRNRQINEEVNAKLRLIRSIVYPA